MICEKGRWQVSAGRLTVECGKRLFELHIARRYQEPRPTYCSDTSWKWSPTWPPAAAPAISLTVSASLLIFSSVFTADTASALSSWTSVITFYTFFFVFCQFLFSFGSVKTWISSGVVAPWTETDIDLFTNRITNMIFKNWRVLNHAFFTITTTLGLSMNWTANFCVRGQCLNLNH